MSEDQRDIPEMHNGWLHRGAGLDEHQSLPEKLVEKYWELKRVCDRLDVRVSERDIAQLIFLGGFGRPTTAEKAPLTLVQLIRKKQVKRGDLVLVKHRNKWVEATLIGVSGKSEVIAQIADDPEERHFKTDECKAAEVAAAAA